MKYVLRAAPILVALALFVGFLGIQQSRTASAAPITTLTQDTAEWLDASKEIVKFYKPGVTAVFFIADDDLEIKKDATATWTKSHSIDVIPKDTDFVIGTGFVGGVPGTSTTPGFDGFATSTGAVYNAAMPADTPLVEPPEVSVGPTGMTLSGVTLTGHSKTLGTFKLISDVPTEHDVVAAFKYHIQDIYPGVNTGTVTKADNRAKITSNSDASGEWVDLKEVTALGASAKSATSKIFRGEILLSKDAAATAKPGELWVQDGDTLTVIFYKDDHTTVIDSTTATIDAIDPTISSVVPADGSILSGDSPVATFTLGDGGSGFSTSLPNKAVDMKINGCPVKTTDGDSELVFTSLTSSQLKVFFTLPSGTDWRDPPTGGTGSCPGARTGGGFGIADKSAPDPVSPSATPPGKGTNHHGDSFTWEIVATDGAGNSKTLTGDKLDLTLDNEPPKLTVATTGKGWDADKKKDKDQKNSIKLTYIEGLDPATVETDGSDYKVAGATVVSALVAGVDMTKDTTPGNNEKNTFVYLELTADLGSSERPKVEQTGSVKDQGGKELKPATGSPVEIASAADGIKATVSNVALGALLLAKDGEAILTFDTDENLTGIDDGVGDCTCLAITHKGAGLTSVKGTVSLPTPSSGKYTFKQKDFPTTGIYGLMIHTKDLGANITNKGHVKVSDEDLSDQFDALAEGAKEAGDKNKLKLDKWPLADKDGDGDLSDEFTVNINGTATTVTVTAIDWGEAETVEMSFSDAVLDGDTVAVTYHYVSTNPQVVEVDTLSPGIKFDPAAGSTTENARPFIAIIFDDDEYAGDTHKTVTVTKATLKDPAGIVLDIMADLVTSDNITYVYTPPADLALGTYTITASGKDEAANEKKDEEGKFTVKVRALKSISLRPGWNLISLPGTPASTDINNVITNQNIDTVLSFDAKVPGGWRAAVRVGDTLEGALETVDGLHGYFVHTSSFDALKVDIPGLQAGSVVLPAAIALVQGWNLVPALSLDPAFKMVDSDIYFAGLKWTKAYGFNAATGKFEGFVPTPTGTKSDDEIKTGKAYYVFISDEDGGTLVP